MADNTTDGYSAGPTDAATPRDFFDNSSEINALNNKRTFDEYQDLGLTAARRSQVNFDQLNNVALQALQNAVETANLTGKQAVKHADVAADALWTDELNPTEHGAESIMNGQAPVNSQLASTASLDTAFTNLTAQNGELITAIIGLANSQVAQNLALAQLIQNGKQAAGSGSPAIA